LPVIASDGVQGIRVSRVQPGTVGERAGLHAGDVVLSVNGYLTTDPGNLAWIISTKAPNGTLSMNVRNVTDGKVHVIAVRLR
jgi:serine protease Do